MRGFLILGTILASLVAWLFWAAPHSQAYINQVSASTLVEWQGSSCVAATGPSLGNPYLLGSPSYTCQPGPPGAVRWARWDELRVSGQLVGVNPIMGDNNWIKCTLFINGAVEISDYAAAGDGTDVSCLRVVN
jgi:hypothetical protein